MGLGDEGLELHIIETESWNHVENNSSRQRKTAVCHRPKKRRLIEIIIVDRTVAVSLYHQAYSAMVRSTRG